MVIRLRREALLKGVVGAAVGAAAAHLFDPRVGRRRRRMLRERGRALVRRSRRAERRMRSTLYGRLMAIMHRHEPLKDYDDVTLVHKVESLLYRDPSVPKGRLNVDAYEGVVSLRGMIDDQPTIDRIVKCAQEIGGVRGVESLLHLPGTPPPHLDRRRRELHAHSTEHGRPRR
jgi:hypothetical protein